jgi:three-Cys-motif partner protein
MPRKDHHDEPYDEGTVLKLEIFQAYAREWLPVFLQRNSYKICIFDLFAGTGYDLDNKPGSPIRLLDVIREQEDFIISKNRKITIYFNEFDKTKYDILGNSIDNYLNNNPNMNKYLIINKYNQDFAVLFDDLYDDIKQNPALVYLDQNGVKFLSGKYLNSLEQTDKTDFLYFISTSYINRFGKTKEFNSSIDVDLDELKKNPFKTIHRSLIDELKKKLPENTNLKLYPFSIKKGPNIFGIIFGAKHPLAFDKFLKIAWSKNQINGEADFDIDDDLAKDQGDLFSGEIPLTKIEYFHKQIRGKVLNKEINNNKEAYDYALSQGHLGKHASDELKKMKEESLIEYSSKSPCVSYDYVYSNNKLKMIEYRLIN